MSDKHLYVIEKLEERKLTYREIANIFNMPTSTVQHIAIRNNLTYGSKSSERGNHGRKPWSFENMTSELAYIIGVYLSDGSATKYHFSLGVKSVEFAQHTLRYFNKLGLDARLKIGNNGFYYVRYSSILFCQWLKEICNNKKKIPDCVKNAPQKCKIAFISALIDGDGTVRKKGTIRICGIHSFVQELPQLLNSMNMHSGISVQKNFTRSHNDYYTIYIRPNEFLDNGGKCSITKKQNRIEKKDLYKCNICGRYTKVTKEAYRCLECSGVKNDKPKISKVKNSNTKKRRKYICPICGEKVMSRKDVQSCQQCYWKSDKFIERMRKQAPAANILANKARWG